MRSAVCLAVAVAALSALTAPALAANGPITAGDGVHVFGSEINNLESAATVNTYGSSLYNDGQDHSESHGEYFTSLTGALQSDQYGAFPSGMSGTTVPSARFALSGQAGGPGGILRSATFAAAGSNATAAADALTYAKASLGDRLTLANDATITLTGHLDGTVSTNAGPALASAAVSLKVYLVDRNDPEAESGYHVLAGYAFDLQGSDTPGSAHFVDESINVPVDLVAGSYYLYTFLETDAITETDNNAAFSLVDFGHTLSFGLSAPASAGLTSELGTVPISVPEPSALSLLALTPLALRRRR